jgi:hypothetical protein
MDDETGQRLAGNEAFFRKVNEAIERGQWPGEEHAPVAFGASARAWAATG